MAPRRTLTQGLKEPSPIIDPETEKAFVLSARGGKPSEPTVSKPSPAPTASVAPPNRVPLSTRLRSDYATALKRASLERQLGGIEPNTLTDILEQAVEPWLRTNGYLA
jgi:hypothetical protein